MRLNKYLHTEIREKIFSSQKYLLFLREYETKSILKINKTTPEARKISPSSRLVIIKVLRKINFPSTLSWGKSSQLRMVKVSDFKELSSVGLCSEWIIFSD